jgi:UDP-N-acetylglucosamine 2-epimerase (non-hydrolysing)
MASFGLGGEGEGATRWRDSNLMLCPPLRYLQFLWLLDNARLVLTDSGGIQEETTVLGVPCLTIRSNTERAVTIREGTNRLVGVEPSDVLATARIVLGEPLGASSTAPPLWDGQSGVRIADDLVEWLGRR